MRSPQHLPFTRIHPTTFSLVRWSQQSVKNNELDGNLLLVHSEKRLPKSACVQQMLSLYRHYKIYNKVGWSTALRPTESIGLLGMGAWDVHLHFHTAPVLDKTGLKRLMPYCTDLVFWESSALWKMLHWLCHQSQKHLAQELWKRQTQNTVSLTSGSFCH